MRGRQRGRQVLRGPLVSDRGRDLTAAPPPAQDVTLATAGTRVAIAQEGVQITGALRQTREEGGLCEIETARGGAEVGLRGRLHPARLVAVEDRVEVHLENLVPSVL